MRAVFGLIRIDAGAVRWNGHEIEREDRVRFGYMPEQRGLYPKMKIGDQLVYFGRIHGMNEESARQAAERWLDELGLSDRIDDPLEALSHGNQQRVQLAVALIHEPDLLVLDEPFNGLDPIGAETMANVLRGRAAQGTAVVFSSHQLDLVEDLCEDVAVINRGSIVMSGEVRSLKDHSPHRVIELELDAEGAEVMSTLDSVVASSFDGFRHRVVVDRSTDVRRLMTDLDLGGHVRHFAFSTLSLSDLFKEAVA